MCRCFFFVFFLFSSLFFLSVWFSSLLSSFVLPFLSSPPPPTPPLSFAPSLAPAGPRPCGLEDDVRQYEQDLAKRLYQARVRASQGSSEAPASSAASQLRSASRPRRLGPDAMHHGGGGCARGLWRWLFLCWKLRKAQTSCGSRVVTVLPPPWPSRFLHAFAAVTSLRLCPLLSAAVLSCTLIFTLSSPLTRVAGHL